MIETTPILYVITKQLIDEIESVCSIKSYNSWRLEVVNVIIY